MKDWNGVLMLYSSRPEHPDVSLWSNASGSWGCDAVWNNRWFQLSWQEVPEFEKALIGIAARCDGCFTVGKGVGWSHCAMQL